MKVAGGPFLIGSSAVGQVAGEEGEDLTCSGTVGTVNKVCDSLMILTITVVLKGAPSKVSTD